jgi:tRNA-2-methylthio-N6-dimethylallyladenosine synthase
MPEQIPAEVSSRRIEELISLQEEKQKTVLKRFVGKEEEILVEGLSKRSNQAISGKGRHAVSITVDGCADDIGKIIRCRVTGIKNNTLMGARIK